SGPRSRRRRLRRAALGRIAAALQRRERPRVVGADAQAAVLALHELCDAVDLIPDVLVLGVEVLQHARHHVVPGPGLDADVLLVIAVAGELLGARLAGLRGRVELLRDTGGGELERAVVELAVAGGR